MSTVPTHNPVPAPPTVPPVLKCQTCQVPLTDATWKNCAECRRKRTESYNHWKNSTSLTSVPVGMMNIMNLSESLLHLHQHSSSLFRTVDSSTPSQASAPTAPLGRHSNELSNYGGPSRSSQLANDLNDQSGWISASTARPPPKAIEYQWSEELIVDLLALPPRSRFAGKFSIVADPAVNNSKCARLFSEQLFARGLPISCDFPSCPPPHHPHHPISSTFT